MAVNKAEAVGANVRAELARNGISQLVLAGHLHLSQTAVSRRLSGSKAFDVNELETVANLVGVPVARLLKDLAPTSSMERAA